MPIIVHNPTPSKELNKVARNKNNSNENQELPMFRLTVPKTKNQDIYNKALYNPETEIVVVNGPAGTGKTYLALAYAINSLLTKTHKRLWITRPTIETGSQVGFLPGDAKEKLGPFVAPAIDTLYKLTHKSIVAKLMQENVISTEIISYMRGHSLDNTILFIDEAQNTTFTEMKMLLTRLGTGSKFIVSGDLEQSDIGDSYNGFHYCFERLQDLAPALQLITLTHKDVVRNDLVAKIIKAYTR